METRKYYHQGISILEVHCLLFEYLFIRPRGGEGVQCLCLVLPPGASSQPNITLQMELGARDRVLPGVI